MADLIFPELSYKIVGLLFRVFKDLGAGLQEKHYQKAVKHLLEKEDIPFLEQVRFDIELYGNFIGRYYFDFIIDNKIVLELKARSYFYRNDTYQILSYLKKSGLKLGLLARFSSDGVKVKRILKGK
ncbi:GxxExxY protein [Candidatus Margulisiibacteriota bacterium]